MIPNLPLTNYLSVIFCFVALRLRLGLVGGLCTFGCQHMSSRGAMEVQSRSSSCQVEIQYMPSRSLVDVQ